VAPQIQFVLGGARSGKSAHAEMLAQQRPNQNQANENLANENLANENLAGIGGRPRLVYIATAEIFDDEMAARIDLHQQRRGPEWSLVEAPVDLPQAIRDSDDEDTVILVDCLSVWTTNLLIHEHDIDSAREALINILANCQGRVLLVASETGLGIVPDNALSRRFRDANGMTNQAVAALADEVFFMMAGIAIRAKPPQ